MEGLTETFENLVLAVIAMTPAVDNDTRGWIMSIVSGIGKSRSSLSVSEGCQSPSRVQPWIKLSFWLIRDSSLYRWREYYLHRHLDPLAT